MPVLPRHTKIESARLLNGYVGIPSKWACSTTAGTATYNMWGPEGCPHAAVVVVDAGLLVGLSAVGDTVVVNHVAIGGAATAITDTANLALFAQDDLVSFSNFSYYGSDRITITRGENIQIVTASGALALVFVDYMVVA
jgi:hypothetical protein